MMDFGTFATLVLVGLLTGGLARFGMREGGLGRLWDLALGLVGSTMAGEISTLTGFAGGAGLVVAALVAFVGAATLIIAQRQLWPAHA
jgi:uncharacterized membrane protein YeaQ/YmgE (transglycosylase-associated protein family)